MSSMTGGWEETEGWEEAGRVADRELWEGIKGTQIPLSS